MRLKSSSVSHDFFCSLYLRSHFRQVEMWGLEQGQESNWCRVGGGRALYSTQPSHSHTRGPGAGPVPGFRGPAFTSGRPGPRLRLSIRKMQQRALWPMLEAGNMLCGNWQYTHTLQCQPCEMCAQEADWGATSPITSLPAKSNRQILRGHRCIYGING